MAASIAQILAQFKADVATALLPEAIEHECRSLGHAWRRRLLTPVVTIQAFLLQVLHGNLACAGVPDLIGKAFSAAAYCRARMRLPVALFECLLRRAAEALLPQTQVTGLWRGHRTWILDGSSFSMPDTRALRKHFGQPGAQKAGCGFPVAHLLALFHAGTGFLLRVMASPLRTHDMARAAAVHPQLGAGDILLADRGLASFAHLALLSQQKVHGLFRAHQKQIIHFRPRRQHTGQHKPHKGQPRSRWVERLGHQDQRVEYVKPRSKPQWISARAYAALPETLLVREVRYRTSCQGYRTQVITLVTTLLDPKAYPAGELAELYGRRWQVEVNLRYLKTTLGLEVLHSKSVAGITKELSVFALVYNLVRVVMLEAGHRQRVPAERISFADALRWLRQARPETPLRPLVVNPHRVGRIEPRVCKRRPKSYRLLTQPRAKLRKALRSKKCAA
jgi:hypothetical protein